MITVLPKNNITMSKVYYMGTSEDKIAGIMVHKKCDILICSLEIGLEVWIGPASLEHKINMLHWILRRNTIC